ncbi:hypothetical protein ABZT47_08045 [Sphaerisporangium sp. NPDC005289]|uniref:hypothetical protein n=1 Tax=Sphaerisporangium sp. NPDC005289 TaxID=3155247 RepID=UPI0033B5BF8A
MNAPTPTPSSSLSLIPTEPVISVTGPALIDAQPYDPSLTDQLQGWGTVAAVVAALLIALIGWWVDAHRREKDRSEGEAQREKDRQYAEDQRAQDRAEAERQRAEDRAHAEQQRAADREEAQRQRTEDQAEAERQRAAERADAERRLHEERQAADERLQLQLGDQRERERTHFLIAQIQEAGDLYAQTVASQDTDRQAIARQRLLTRLPAIPGRYASLLKRKMGVPHDNDASFTGSRRMQALNINEPAKIDPHMIYDELAENIAELLGSRSASSP